VEDSLVAADLHYMKHSFYVHRLAKSSSDGQTKDYDCADLEFRIRI